jgi:hypothetical protein
LHGDVFAELPLVFVKADTRIRRVKEAAEAPSVDCRGLLTLGLIEPHNEVFDSSEAQVFRMQLPEGS